MMIDGRGLASHVRLLSLTLAALVLSKADGVGRYRDVNIYHTTLAHTAHGLWKVIQHRLNNLRSVCTHTTLVVPLTKI